MKGKDSTRWFFFST